MEVAPLEPDSLEEALADDEPARRCYARRMCQGSGVHDLMITGTDGGTA